MSGCCAPKKNNQYDLAAIRAGSAGFSAAITAAEQGANVALIGHRLLACLGQYRLHLLQDYDPCGLSPT